MDLLSGVSFNNIMLMLSEKKIILGTKYISQKSWKSPTIQFNVKYLQSEIDQSNSDFENVQLTGYLCYQTTTS